MGACLRVHDNLLVLGLWIRVDFFSDPEWKMNEDSWGSLSLSLTFLLLGTKSQFQNLKLF